jgi:predicted aspartyl protease
LDHPERSRLAGEYQMLILGTFDSSGNAIINIRVTGTSGSKNYNAIIDTGFSGFVALPFLEMIELGLTTQGATNVMLGDGSIITNLVASADVTLSTQVENGTVLLDENSSDVLIGMAFLREFKKSLILTNSAVVLYDEHEALETIIQLMREAPQGQPNLSIDGEGNG